MNVSDWNTTPATVSFLLGTGSAAAGAGTADSAGTSKMALPSVSMNCLISASIPRPKKIVGVLVSSGTCLPPSTSIAVASAS